MRFRPLLITLTTVAIIVSACGSTGDDASSTSAGGTAAGATATTAAPAQVGSIGDAVEVAAGAPSAAEGAACVADKTTLTSAVELYVLLEGTVAGSQQALVDAELIQELSPWFVVTPQGEVVPAPGSPCS